MPRLACVFLVLLTATAHAQPRAAAPPSTASETLLAEEQPAAYLGVPPAPLYRSPLPVRTDLRLKEVERVPETAVPAPPTGPVRFARWAFEDVRAVASELTLPRLGVAAGFVGALSILSTQDDYFGEQAPRMYSEDNHALFDAVNLLGEPETLGAAAGLFAVTLVTDDRRLQDAAFTSFQAGLYTRFATNAIKSVVGRARPFQAQGPYAFEPFSGNTSFPSGHTSLAFALVTPWVVYYPGPVTYGLFAVSTGTAVARMAMERHWATDVIAGAALGTLTGYWLAQRHLDAHQGLQITPSLTPDGAALTLTYRF